MDGPIRKAKGSFSILSLKLHNPTLPIVTTTHREDGQIDVNFLKSSFVPGAKVSHFPSEEIDSELQKINWNELLLLWIYDFLWKRRLRKNQKVQKWNQNKGMFVIRKFCIVLDSLTDSFRSKFLIYNSLLIFTITTSRLLTLSCCS